MSYREKLVIILNKSHIAHKQELLKFFNVLSEEHSRLIYEQNKQDPSFLQFLANNLANKKAANDTESQAMWKEILGEEEKYLESLS